MAITIRTLPHRSFNKHDCTVSTVEGRIDVKVDMARRLGLVVSSLAKVAKGFRDSSEVAAHINHRLGAKYSDRDILTALRKLRSAGLVTLSNGWRLTPTGLAKFRAAKILKGN